MEKGAVKSKEDRMRKGTVPFLFSSFLLFTSPFSHLFNFLGIIQI
jgi:hypothetical protein